jgi:hypothetical protein
MRHLVAALLAVAVVAAALESVSHVHGDGTTHGPAAVSHDVAVSIIVGPDPPSAQQHWHAGYIVPPEVCSACVLLSQAGWVSATAVPTAIHTSGRPRAASLLDPFCVALASIGSRAPPRPA